MVTLYDSCEKNRLKMSENVVVWKVFRFRSERLISSCEKKNCIMKRLMSCRGQLKCDGTRAETRFRLSAKRTSPFESAGASVQSTTGGRGVRISGSNAGYTMFRGSVKGTGYPLHSPVSPSLPSPVHHRVPSYFILLL